jgi:Protein of unknown function (DUF2934)
MPENNTSTRDTDDAAVLAKRLRTRDDPDAELLQPMIAKLAQSKAQARGCRAGPEMSDWLEAEFEIYAVHRWALHRREDDRRRSSTDE